MTITLLILGTLGLICSGVFYFLNKEEGEERNLPVKSIFYPSIVLFLGTVLFMMFVVKVGGQEVGVVVKPTGVESKALTTGWNVVMPWYKVFPMDKTQWVYTCSDNPKEGQKKDADAIWAPTSDGIKLGFDVSVSWRINPNEAPWIFSNISEADGGPDGRYKWIEENIIRAKIKSILSLTVSKFNPIQAYSTGRSEIERMVFSDMKKELLPLRLIVDQVNIREVYYNKEYEVSINNKKLAEQEALRLMEVTKQKQEQLIQAKIEKDIAIQQAEGEAKALQIKGSSIASNPKIIELEWINKWNGALPTYMTGSQGSMLMLNLNK